MTSDGSVLLHVVAGQDSEGLEALGMTSGQSSVEETESSLGRVLVLEVLLDVRVFGLQFVGVFVVVVATLGDGHGNNVRVRVGHLGNDSLAVVGRKQERGDTADNIGAAALGTALNDSVEAVLLLQDIAHTRVEGLETNPGDGIVARTVLLHQLMQVHGQVRSVEATDTDVDNAFFDSSAVIGRHSHSLATLLGSNLREILAEKLECLLRRVRHNVSSIGKNNLKSRMTGERAGFVAIGGKCSDSKTLR